MRGDGLKSRHYFICHILASMAYLIAVMVVVGWLTGPQLTQPRPQWEAMSFYTALCIMLTAAAVFTLPKNLWLTLLFSMVSATMAVVILMDYLFGWNFYQNQWGGAPYRIIHDLYPGGMAPNTAFCVLFLNLAIGFYSFSNSAFSRIIQMTFSILVAGIGFMVLTGYLLGIEIVYTWPGVSAMSLYAAFCVTLLSIALSIVFYVRHHRFYVGHGVFQTISILVAGNLFFLLLWQNFAQSAFLQIRESINADGVMIANEIELNLQRNYLTARRFFIHLGNPDVTLNIIRHDALDFLSDLPGLALIAWRRDKLYQIWSEEPSFKDDVIRISQACRQGKQKNNIFTNIISGLATNGRTFLCMDYNRGHHSLMLFNVQEMAANAMVRTNTSLTGMTIQYEDDIIFRKINEASPGFARQWMSTYRLQLDFLSEPVVFKWWPSPHYVTNHTPWLPTVTILLGLIITCLLALVNHLKNRVVLDNSLLKTSISDKTRKLMEMESKYQRIFDNSPDLLLFVDSDCRIIECNQTFMSTMGITRKKSITEHTVFEVLNIQNTSLAKNILNRISDTGMIDNLELDLVNQFDTTSRMMLKVNPLVLQDKREGYLFSFRDISNIKALQEELASRKYSENLFHENKAIYDLILDETTDGWWDINLETGQCMLSGKLLNSLGYDKEHFKPGIDFFRDHALPEDFKALEDNLKKHLASKGRYPLHQEVRYRHRNGSLVWILCRGQGIVDPDGKIRRIVGTHIDISPLKFAQDNLSLKNLELNLIYKTTRLILVQDDINEAFKSCLLMIGQAMRFVVGIVYRFNKENYCLEAGTVWHQGMDEESDACITAMKRLKIREKEGFVGRVWHERKTLWFEKNGGDSVTVEQSLCPHFRFEGALAFPILVADNLYAVFEFFCRDVHLKTGEELDMIDVLAAQMSLAVERKLAYHQLQHLALHDELTKLPNRRACMEMLDLALSKARRNHTEFALMFIDLDDFKKINDDFGHHAGDVLLIEITGRFKESLRAHDYLARLAGDEFLLIVTDLATRSILTLLAERIIESLSRPVIIEQHEINVSVSIGIAVFPQAGETVESLLQAADKALYQAKKEGKKGFYFSSSK
ncbi:putative regulatory protein [Legionella spiritensis]|nr:putative regulatory protein [Legionella spiritensis]